MCSQIWLVTWSETTVSTPFARSPGNPGRQLGSDVNSAPVDGDRKAFVSQDVVDPTQSILKAVSPRQTGQAE